MDTRATYRKLIKRLQKEMDKAAAKGLKPHGGKYPTKGSPK